MGISSPVPIGPPQIANDVEGVVLAHGLSQGERSTLAAIVVGAVTGNRDLPLYKLARAIAKACRSEPGLARAGGALGLVGEALGGGCRTFGRLSAALLDFLLSMGEFGEVEAIEAAVAPVLADPVSETAMRDCANGFARALYRYRSRHLPAERNRAKFADLRRFLGGTDGRLRRPDDGDALEFWVAHGSRDGWTLYETVLEGLIAFTLAEEECRAAAPVGGGPVDEDGEALPLWERAERQVLLGEDLGEMLADAVAELEGSPLKIFKEVELQPIRKLTRLGRFSQSWPRSSLGLIAFGPCQASLVQLVKDRAPESRLAEVADCEAADDYRAVLATTSGYAHTLGEVAALAERFGVGETDPGSSTEGAGPSVKDFPLMRRKSFKELSPAELAEALEGIVEAQAALKRFLEAVVRHWSGRIAGTGETAGREDRARFSAKLKALYLAPGEVSHG